MPGVALRDRLVVEIPGAAGAAAAPDPTPVPHVVTWPAQDHGGPGGATSSRDRRPGNPGGPLVVANTHLSFVPAGAGCSRGGSVGILLPPPGPVLLMGDMNMTHPKPAQLTGYRSLAVCPTFPAAASNRQLDHILLRGDFGRVVASNAPEMPLSITGRSSSISLNRRNRVLETDHYVRFERSVRSARPITDCSPNCTTSSCASISFAMIWSGSRSAEHGPSTSHPPLLCARIHCRRRWSFGLSVMRSACDCARPPWWSAVAAPLPARRAPSGRLGGDRDCS